ncbi:DUF3597 family protein [Polaromonas sp.]
MAKELGYTSDRNDGAVMNIRLHDLSTNKLAENSDKVPTDLKG